MTKHGLPMAWLKDHLRHAGDACVYWPFTRTKEGYARVWHDGAMRPAHRVMCSFLNGPPPEEAYVAAHNCGKGHLGCMNPKHLRWATKAENQADRIGHGTSNRGEMSGTAKLTALDVEAIREMAPFATQVMLRKYYGVSAAQMSRIVNRTQWVA